MIKLSGIMLAFAASAIFGFFKAYELKRRRTLLLDFRELLLHISTEMRYFREPLPQLFERLAAVGQPEKETVFLLREWLTGYRQENTDLSFLWKQSVERVYEKEPVNDADLAVIKKCGDFLGQSDVKSQLEHFSFLNRQVDRQLAEAEEAIRTKGRMYSKLGVSAGLIIAIVFI